MVDSSKNNLINKLDPDSNDSWFKPVSGQMPEEMKESILESVSREMKQEPAPNRTPVLTMLLRITAAACLALIVVFTYEQVYTLKKITRLEDRICQTGNKEINSFKSQNKLLIINSFVSWSDIKQLGAQPSENSLLELFPSIVKKNIQKDQHLKSRVSQYLKDYQLAIKIN